MAWHNVIFADYIYITKNKAIYMYIVNILNILFIHVYV